MPKYKITVEESMSEVSVFIIEADDEEEAQEEAIMRAKQGRFSHSSSLITIIDSEETDEVASR